jgi:hypothetical protein
MFAPRSPRRRRERFSGLSVPTTNDDREL